MYPVSAMARALCIFFTSNKSLKLRKKKKKRKENRSVLLLASM